MSLRFFMIPVRDSSAAEQELNGFIASHKILSIDRHLVDEGSNSFWTICVDYMSTVPGEATRQQNLSRNRVDYKTILLADEFAVSAGTKSWRFRQAVSKRHRVDDP